MSNNIGTMKRQILIVEDDELVYRSLAHMLDGDNYQLLWTQTGHEALRRSLDHSYDLLVLDLNVRDIDSSRALDWFGRLHPFLPVILLGGEQDQASAGGAVLLRKPVERGKLLQTVEALLAESHQEQMSRMTGTLYGKVSVP